MAKKLFIGYGTGLVVLALLVYAAINLAGGRNPVGGSAEKKLRVTLEQGQELGFNFRRSGIVRLDMVSLLPPQGERSGVKLPASGKPSDMQVDEQGDLLLRVYGTDTDSWTVGGMILNFKSGGGAEDQIKPCPFSFTISATGNMDNFRFGPAITEAARLHVLGVLYELQFVFPQKPDSRWQARQRDTVGSYQADYRMTARGSAGNPVGVSRSISRYENNEIAATNFSPVAAAAQIRILKDNSDAELSADINLIENLRHDHSSQLVSKDKLIGETNIVFTAHRIRTALSGTLPSTLAGLQEQMAICSQKLVHEKVTSTDPQLNAITGTADLAGMMQIFLKKMASDDYQEQKLAEKLVINYLRQHPSEASRMIAYINNRSSNRLDSAKELAIWKALALAGTREAQQAIAGALSNTGFNMQTRTTAASHLFNIEHPEPFVVSELWRFHKSASAERGETQLKSTALFAIGAIAANPQISDAMRASIVNDLSAQLQQAESPEARSVVLMAVGNSQRPELLGDLLPYLKDQDQNLRAVAYQALSRLKSDAAMELIQSGYRSESSTFVKSRLIEAVGSMADTEKAGAFIRAEAGTEQNNALLLPMAGYLARNARQSEANIQALNSIINKKPSGQVLREIYRHVSPDTLKGKR